MAAVYDEEVVKGAVGKLTDPAAGAHGDPRSGGAERVQVCAGTAYVRIRHPPHPAVPRLARPALSERRKAVDAVKEATEALHTPQYAGFLALVFEPLSAQLTSTQPQFDKDGGSELQSLRHAALEALSRLPANEAFKQYASKLADVCLAVSTLCGNDEAQG